MCRYGCIEYKNTYGCFQCRKGFKRRLDKDLPPEHVRAVRIVNCPDCGEEMTNLGKDLRLPRKDQRAQWLALAYVKHHFHFLTCGCDGIGMVPQNLREARQFMKHHRRKSLGQVLFTFYVS